MPTAAIAIFVRHAADCKHRADEFSKRCQCRKHFRWTASGKQHRQAAGTRSWTEAERLKRDLEDKLAGRGPVEMEARSVRDAGAAFLQSKRVEGATAATLKKYTLDVSRLSAYCERTGVYGVQALTAELLTQYIAGWAGTLPSSYTRAKARERLATFLRFCSDSDWIKKAPKLPRVKVSEVPTMPLTEGEYVRLLEAVPIAHALRGGSGKLNTWIGGGSRLNRP